VTEIVDALAKLAWPLIIALIVVAYRYEIRDILRRLSRVKKATVLGQQIELEEELDQLKATTEKAEAEVAPQQQPEGQSERAGSKPLFENEQLRDAQKLEREILSQARTSPKVALMLLSAEIDRRLRELLAATGWHQNIRATSTLRAIKQLQLQGSLPKHVIGSVKLFRDIRNRIIHGGPATDEEIIRAIDSGFVLLKAIDAIPVEISTVHSVNITLYDDAGCTHLVLDAKGVTLEATSPGGFQKFRVVPTTQAHFQVGRRVAWEWNIDHVWGPTWYKDPDTGECKQAWLQSAEFIGRHLDGV
jgi:hypothetical protein